MLTENECFSTVPCFKRRNFSIQKIGEFCEINLQIGKSNNLREINFRDQTNRKQNPRNKLPWIFILGYPFENRDVEK